MAHGISKLLCSPDHGQQQNATEHSSPGRVSHTYMQRESRIIIPIQKVADGHLCNLILAGSANETVVEYPAEHDTSLGNPAQHE